MKILEYTYPDSKKHITVYEGSRLLITYSLEYRDFYYGNGDYTICLSWLGFTLLWNK